MILERNHLAAENNYHEIQVKIKGKGNYLVTGVSINAAVLIALTDHVIFQNVNHARHLTENQHTVTALFHLAEQLVQQHHLTTIHVQVLAHGILSTILHSREEVRMVAALAELHDDVQNGRTGAVGVSGGGAVDGVDVAHQHTAVEVLLHRRHACEEDGLGLGRQGLLNVGLEAAEHERTEQFVELANHALLGLVVVHIQVEPVVELENYQKKGHNVVRDMLNFWGMMHSRFILEARHLKQLNHL